jgi:chemotaxis protein CheD
MKANAHTPPVTGIVEVFLHPGDYHFGNAETRIVTLLGSCVSITLWHPRLRVGGMCHYMLPSRGVIPEGASYDGRYGDEAMKMLMNRIWKLDVDPAEFHAKVFGGANMFPLQCQKKEMNVGDRNLEMAQILLQRYEIPLKAQHIGGDGHRKLMLDVWSGDVWLKHQPMTGPRQEPRW